jgi:hypothetical protein
MKKDKIINFNQYYKEYYLKNKEKMILYGCNRIECDSCHRIVSRNQLSRHKQSKICAKFTEISNQHPN